MTRHDKNLRYIFFSLLSLFFTILFESGQESFLWSFLHKGKLKKL